MVTDSLEPFEILGLTIIGEARGESILGQIAVGCDIRNRVNKQSKSYHDVCLAPLQFSCWNQNDPNYAMLQDLAAKMFDGQELINPSERQCMYVARGIVNNNIIDILNNDIFYMTTVLFNSPKRPSWASNPKNVIIVGHQTFFSL